MSGLKSLGVLALSWAMITSAGAVEPAASAADNPLRQYIRAGLSLDEYVASALIPFDAIADDAGVVSAAEMRELQSKDFAARRASAIGAILRYDLNGDFLIASSEIVNAQTTAAERAHAARKKKKAETLAMRQTRLALIEADRLLKRYDANHDGSIDMKEITQLVDQEEAGARRGDQITALLATPLGKDGKLTRTEVMAYAVRTFYTVDKNKDGRIASEEYATAMRENEKKIALLR